MVKAVDVSLKDVTPPYSSALGELTPRTLAEFSVNRAFVRLRFELWRCGG